MRPSVKYCISVLTKRANDLLNAGWESILQEHPERERLIRAEMKSDQIKIDALKEGIKILDNL